MHPFILSKFSPIQSQLSKINWEKIGELIISHIFEIVIITLIFIVINRIGKFVLMRLLDQYRTTNGGSKRGDTIYVIVMNTFKYTVLFCYLYIILSNIGVPVGTLVAGAGIVSIAIGLGAQGLVSDLINGLTILIEGQLRVGDQVTIQNIDGKVFAIGLRTIELHASDGTVHFIPNRSVALISNHSQGNSTLTFYLTPANVADVDRSKEILKIALNKAKAQSDKLHSNPIITAPTINQDTHKISIKVSAKVNLDYQSAMQTMLLDRCIQALVAEHVELENK